MADNKTPIENLQPTKEDTSETQKNKFRMEKNILEAFEDYTKKKTDLASTKEDMVANFKEFLENSYSSIKGKDILAGYAKILGKSLDDLNYDDISQIKIEGKPTMHSLTNKLYEQWLSAQTKAATIAEKFRLLNKDGALKGLKSNQKKAFAEDNPWLPYPTEFKGLYAFFLKYPGSMENYVLTTTAWINTAINTSSLSDEHKVRKKKLLNSNKKLSLWLVFKRLEKHGVKVTTEYKNLLEKPKTVSDDIQSLSVVQQDITTLVQIGMLELGEGVINRIEKHRKNINEGYVGMKWATAAYQFKPSVAQYYNENKQRLRGMDADDIITEYELSISTNEYIPKTLKDKEIHAKHELYLKEDEVTVLNWKNPSKSSERKLFERELIKRWVDKQSNATKFSVPNSKVWMDGNENLGTEFQKKLYSLEKEDYVLGLPGWYKIVFLDKQIQLLDSTEGYLREPDFTIDLKASHLPPYMAVWLGLPIEYKYDEEGKVVAASTKNSEGFLGDSQLCYPMKQSGNVKQYLDIKNWVITWIDTKPETPIGVCRDLNRTKGPKAYQFYITPPHDASEVEDEWLHSLSIQDVRNDEITFEADKNNSTIKKLWQNLYENNRNPLGEASVAQMMMLTELWAKDVEFPLNSKGKSIGDQYQDPSDFLKWMESKEKEVQYGNTKFVNLAKDIEPLPDSFIQYHSNTDPIPGRIESNGELVANSQYFEKYLREYFEESKQKKLFTIQRWTPSNIDLDVSLLSKKQLEFLQDIEGVWKVKDGIVHTSVLWFRRVLKSTILENDRLINLSAWYDYVMGRFEQWKNHESMHRFLMTQMNLDETSRASYSAGEELDHHEVLDLWLVGVYQKPIEITHELLCMIVEWDKKRAWEDVSEMERENARRHCNGYVVLEVDLRRSGAIVLWNVNNPEEYRSERVLQTNTLNVALNTFFDGKIQWRKDGITGYRDFAMFNPKKREWFDLTRVRQYSQVQAGRSDSIEISPAANTQAIPENRIVTLNTPPSAADLQANTDDIYVWGRQSWTSNILDNQQNFVWFEIRDVNGNPYTWASLTPKVRNNIQRAAQWLGDRMRQWNGNIHVPRDVDNNYIIDESLPDDLKEVLDQEIKGALGPQMSERNQDFYDNGERNDNQERNGPESDESSEVQEDTFEEAFEKAFYGDKFAKPENGTVILARWQPSKLQWWGSVWMRWEYREINEGDFQIVFDNTTEIDASSVSTPPISKTAQGVKDMQDKFKELYKFTPGWLYTDLASKADTYKDKDGSQKLSNGLDQFGGLDISGDWFSKKYVDDDGKTSSQQPVEYWWDLNAKNWWDNVLFKVISEWDKVRVKTEPTDAEDQYDMDHLMDVPSFLLFMADKWLKPYCQQEIDRESAKYPDRWDQSDEIEWGSFWDSFVSVSAMMAGLKKFPEAFKYRQEQKEKFEASLFAKQWADTLIPDGMNFLYANEIKNDLVTEHDDTMFGVINGYKDKISQKDGAGGTHDKRIAKIIDAEVFQNPQKNIRFKHKAAWYLLYAAEKWNMYIRSLAKYADEGMWTKVLLGEAKQQQMLRERAEFYAKLKTNGASDDDYDKLAKFEMKFIFEHTTDQAMFGPKYGRTLEDLHDKYSGADDVEWVKSSIASKWNFYDLYELTLVWWWIWWLKPKIIMGALEAMEDMVEDDTQYNLFYKAVMQILLSWIASFEFDNQMKDRLRNICRKRGIPIGMLCKQIGHPTKILNIINYIAKQWGKEGIGEPTKSQIESLNPNSFTKDDKFKKISKKVWEWRWRKQNGRTVMEAFNYENNYLIKGLAEWEPDIKSYFSTDAVFNPVKDYRQEPLGDGSSPFYNGILNLAPGTFRSQLLTANQSWSFGKDSRSSNELWSKFGGWIDTFKNLIDGSRSDPVATSAYIEFIWKKFKSYFGDDIGPPYFWFMKDAIDEWDEEYFERLVLQKLLKVRYTIEGKWNASEMNWRDLKWENLGGKEIKVNATGIKEVIYQETIKKYKDLIWNAFQWIPSQVDRDAIYNLDPYG